MKVTDDTIAATNTSLKTDKLKADVVKTPGGRKETHEAKYHETTVAVSADSKIKGVNSITVSDESKATLVEAVEIKSSLIRPLRLSSCRQVAC